MLGGRIDTDEVKNLPKWSDGMPTLSEWKESGIYEKAFFRDPIPTLDSNSSAQVEMYQEEDGLYYYIIQINEEISSFLMKIEYNILFHPSLFPQ